MNFEYCNYDNSDRFYCDAPTQIILNVLESVNLFYKDIEFEYSWINYNKTENGYVVSDIYYFSTDNTNLNLAKIIKCEIDDSNNVKSIIEYKNYTLDEISYSNSENKIKSYFGHKDDLAINFKFDKFDINLIANKGNGEILSKLANILVNIWDSK